MNGKAERNTYLQYVSFSLGNETFAVDVMKIKGVERIIEITAVPQSADFLEGIIHLREEIIPVVDMRLKFGLPKNEFTKETRIILIEIGKMVIGVIVDRVYEVFQIKEEEIGQMPNIGIKVASRELVRGVAKIGNKLIIIIDIDKMFTEDETAQIMGNV